MSNPISIIILANCDAQVLEHMLPEMLQQHYEPGYEIIVVRESKKGSVTDLMEQLMMRYDNLRTTFLPAQPIYVTDYEVEIMLGVKAAKYNDVIIVAPEFMPPTDEWLLNVSEIICQNDVPLLLGGAPYSKESSFFHRYSHRKKVKKALKRWLKCTSYSKSDIMLEKKQRHLFTLSFKKETYLDTPLLRDIIYLHEDA